MDSKKILTGVIAVGALFLSLLIIQSVLTGGGNSLSKLFLYLSIGGAVCGFVNPKAGIFFLIIMGFYLDMMKRFLIIEGVVGIIDLVQILALAPITFAGMLAGQCVRCLFGKDSFNRREAVAFAFSVLLSVAVLGLSLLKQGFGIRAIAEAGSQAAYISFVWLGFYYFDTAEKRHKFFRFALLWFVPVVIYAYKQLIFGYSDLEYDYALSGLTIVQNPLLEGRIEYYRIFSTMSSSGAYGLMTILIGAYGLLAFSDSNKSVVFLAKLFGVICLASLIPGAGRTGWAIAIIIVLGSFMFRRRVTTFLVYGGAALLLTVLFLKGDQLIETSANAVSGLADSEWEARSLQVGNFAVRAEGIKNWTTNPNYFSWFGLTEEEKEGSGVHDMLGEIYVGFGAVGLSITIITGVSLLIFTHRRVFFMKSEEDKKFLAFLLSLIFGLLLGSIVSGGGIRIFPVVFYFWAFVGMVCVMSFARKTEKLEEEVGGDDVIKIT
ncbi:MAG: hypothetical protein ACSHYB_00570 [Roseibacillus sp.]